MKVKPILLAVLFAAAFQGTLMANRDEGMHAANGFFIPEGDADAGKKAFEELKCSSCHWVQNESKLSAPVAEKIGPMLGTRQSKYSRGWIANSIVSPSHTIALDSKGYADDSDLSRMGDFTEVMTVRQMIDIVEYVKSLREMPHD